MRFHGFSPGPVDHPCNRTLWMGGLESRARISRMRSRPACAQKADGFRRGGRCSRERHRFPGSLRLCTTRATCAARSERSFVSSARSGWPTTASSRSLRRWTIGSTGCMSSQVTHGPSSRWRTAGRREAAGPSTLRLWVFEANLRARRFYDRHGLVERGFYRQRRRGRCPRRSLRVVAFRRGSITRVSVRPLGVRISSLRFAADARS